MFNPTRDQVREFFLSTWQKHQNKSVLAPIESIALKWILEHPEYHSLLSSAEAKEQEFSISKGQTNPFLHLSMHLAIEEQISINSPPGIKNIFEQLAQKSNPHEAMHEIMECLGQVIWESQRLGTPLNNNLYLELLQKRINKH
ncbi:hypothetical protein V757_06850 [Pelistega indica]|uniref:DUF1841 domain-containing protein n=1 Tax=Pelistega indica TaxID=1414851 RepID=V8G5A9_9BURK|nr:MULTISPECIES: DUF1841 family protein [Pelistega]ETD71153.1 hypothetical protein V757_06850 [Pelistega indica]